MGDSFEVVVDVDATLDEAPRLGRTAIAWLTGEGIIEASPTSDRDAQGAGYYLPGPRHRLAAAHRDDPYTLAFARLGLGRLEVTTGRSVAAVCVAPIVARAHQNQGVRQHSVLGGPRPRAAATIPRPTRGSLAWVMRGST